MHYSRDPSPSRCCAETLVYYPESSADLAALNMTALRCTPVFTCPGAGNETFTCVGTRYGS